MFHLALAKHWQVYLHGTDRVPGNLWLLAWSTAPSTPSTSNGFFEAVAGERTRLVPTRWLSHTAHDDTCLACWNMLMSVRPNSFRPRLPAPAALPAEDHHESVKACTSQQRCLAASACLVSSVPLSTICTGEHNSKACVVGGCEAFVACRTKLPPCSLHLFSSDGLAACRTEMQQS